MTEPFPTSPKPETHAEAEKLQHFCTWLEDRLEDYIARHDAMHCKTSNFAHDLQAWADSIKRARVDQIMVEPNPAAVAA